MAWNTTFLLGRPIFRGYGYVSFRECNLWRWCLVLKMVIFHSIPFLDGYNLRWPRKARWFVLVIFKKFRHLRWFCMILLTATVDDNCISLSPLMDCHLFSALFHIHLTVDIGQCEATPSTPITEVGYHAQRASSEPWPSFALCQSISPSVPEGRKKPHDWWVQDSRRM